jgi:hypothetical protein
MRHRVFSLKIWKIWYDHDNQRQLTLAIVKKGGLKLCTIHRTGLYYTLRFRRFRILYFSWFAAGVSRISISSYGAASSMKTSRLPLPQQQQQQQQGGKRSTSMGPRERSLNRNPLPSLTPVGRKCKYESFPELF